MIIRILIALVGASAITIGLLLGMNEVAESLRERDGTKFFRINDIVVSPSGRSRPARPSAPERPPDRLTPQLPRSSTPGIGLGIESPTRPQPAVADPDIPPITLPDASAD